MTTLSDVLAQVSKDKNVLLFKYSAVSFVILIVCSYAKRTYSRFRFVILLIPKI